MNEDIDLLDKIEKGITSLHGTQKTILTDVSRLDKETRKAFEDIEKLKKFGNNTDGSFKSLVRKIEEVQSLVQRANIAAFGDPIKRITDDEEKSERFNALARKTLLKTGERLPEHLQKALGEDTSPGSGYITGGMAREIYDVLSTFGVWPMFDVELVGSKTTTVPVDTADPVCVIISEGTQIPDDENAAGEAPTVSVKIFATLINVFQTLLDDAEYDLTSRVLRKFRNATNRRLDHMAIAANAGANVTDGGFTGIFYGGTAAAAAAGNTTVGTTDFDDWIRCLTAVAPEVLTRDARWWLHPTILAKAMLVKDGMGRPIFQSLLERPDFKAIGGILGYAIQMSHAAPSTDAANAKIAAFGDPMGYYLAMRKEFQFDGSDHHKWDYYQRSFRSIARAGGRVRAATAFAVLTLPAA
ncbi:MAG: phage major capsid protein [Verrucomicrobia bacterium]|nr:phage major capsid protein [Verrucomicrobiota bacterium]